MGIKEFLICCKIKEIVSNIYPLSLKKMKGKKREQKKDVI